MAEGFKAPEQELGIISSEKMPKISEWSTFWGLGGSDEPGGWHSSREGPEAPMRGEMLPRTAGVDVFGVRDQTYSV